MTVENKNWDKTCNRFVAFFDIMGFKEMVERNDHNIVVEKLETLKATLSSLAEFKYDKKDLEFAETRSITFSDSIVFFSKADTLGDANKIILDSVYLILKALENGIAIKGALSFGKLTVDLDNSLFFGRPIIDAYLLHDSLQLYTAVIDNHCELKLSELKLQDAMGKFITDYKANFKTGKITHKLIKPGKDFTKQHIEFVKKLRNTVSGAPRIYLDNTLEFLNSIDK